MSALLSSSYVRGNPRYQNQTKAIKKSATDQYHSQIYMQNPQQDRKPNLAIYEMKSMPQPSGGHSRSAKLVQYSEVNQCEAAHWRYRRKPHRQDTTQRGHFTKHLVTIKTQLTRSGREAAQPGKGPCPETAGNITLRARGTAACSSHPMQPHAREMTGMQSGKEGIKLSLFTGDVIVYAQNLTRSTPKSKSLLKPICAFMKLTGCEYNSQKSTIPLNTRTI